MWDAFIYGVGIGLSISLLLGPIFFALIQTTIQKGIWSGIILSAGITISDVIIVALAYTSLAEVSSEQWFQWVLTFFGGGFLIFFGLKTALKSKTQYRAALIYQRGRNERWRQFAHGIVLNTFHPGVWLYWLGVASIIRAHTLPVSSYPKTIFASAILTVFVMDVIKASLAGFLKKRITQSLILWINRIIGSMLVVLGVVMIATHLRNTLG
jgi:threonine/homoserine/homoserine lactone efflux protein